VIETDAVVLRRTTPIDNSAVVRELDPRSSREIWLLLLLVATLAGGMAAYAWPHFELRQVARERQLLEREKERLLEENRKLRLEKATLENLRRVEMIAVRELGLEPPPAERVVIVEAPAPLPEGAQIATRALGDAREPRP